MTREEAIKELKENQAFDGDHEIQHNNADGVLCELLKTLGYADVVHEFHAVPKWYA